MKYYLALEEKHDYFTGHTLIEHELITEKERNTKFRYISDEYLKPVEISKNKTFKMFGVRFLDHDIRKDYYSNKRY